MFCSLVVQGADFTMSISGSLFIRVKNGFIHDVEEMARVSNLGRDFAWEDAHEHQIKMDIWQVRAVCLAQALPFTQPALKFGAMAACGESLESADSSHDHLFGTPFVFF